MLAEIIREVTKCEENTTIYSENVLAWVKRVEAQRDQTAVNSSLHEAKISMQSYKKMSSTQTKDSQQIQSAQDEDVNTVDKNTN